MLFIAKVLLLTFVALEPYHVIGRRFLLKTEKSDQNQAGVYFTRKTLVLKGRSRNLHLNGTALKKVTEALKQKTFSLDVGIKPLANHYGDLFSANTHKHLLLRIAISTAENEVDILYNSENGKRVIRVNFKFLPNQWHNVSFQMRGDRLELAIDCRKLIDGNFTPADFSEISGRSTKVWIGQGSKYRHHLLATLRDLKIGHFDETEGYNCPAEISQTLDAMVSKDFDPRFCPNCFKYLKHRISNLDRRVRELESKVDEFQERVAIVQLHQRGCDGDTRYYKEGESWTNHCTACTCSRGSISCHPIGCEPLKCLHPIMKQGKCCPTCGTECVFNGEAYEHGEIFHPKKCAECECLNGEERCRFVRDCPKLKCPKDKQIKLEHDCCAKCQDVDFCAANACHPNATCVNEKYGRRCECKPGFFGLGGTPCFDIDECKFNKEVQEQIGCGDGATCINTPGSYRCECRPGFELIDGRHCLDVILHMRPSP